LSDHPAGNIYDLGYRTYSGQRLGRASAVLALYVYSLRASFGLGRRATSKIFPIALAILTLFPAVVQLGIGAVAADIVELFRAEDYYGYVQTILALFCAAVAPEVVGRDQRNRTLALYFSRSLTRLDYASAKLAALTTALLILTLGPQLVLLIGNGLASNNLDGYIREEWDQVPRIVASAFLLSGMLAAISLAVASQTPRRAFATGAILAVFHIAWVIVDIIVAFSEDSVTRFVILISPLHVMRGFTMYIFDATPGVDTSLDTAGVAGEIYVVVGVLFILLASAYVAQRYRTIAA
jgi:ABC-2 type transport system permease protein